MKRVIYNVIEKNNILMNLYLNVFNKGFGFKSNLKGIKIKKNILKVNGLNNVIECGKSCLLVKNDFYIAGNNNQIQIGNDVSAISDGQMKNIIITGDGNKIQIDDNCKMTNVQIFIWGNNNKIHICSDCSCTYVQYHIEQNNNCIDIGKNTTMHGREHRCIHMALDEGTTLKIKEDCMLSNDIQIRTTDSHSIVDKYGKRINHAEGVIVGNHSWIGMSAIILKGCEISDHSVVAAGSVCTKKYKKENVIIAGNPAKYVKEEIDWDRKFV